jgi:hypothetical protein
MEATYVWLPVEMTMARPLPVATEVPARQMFMLSMISKLKSGGGRTSRGFFSTGISSPVNEACATVNASDKKRAQSPGKTSPPGRILAVSMEQNEEEAQIYELDRTITSPGTTSLRSSSTSWFARRTRTRVVTEFRSFEACETDFNSCQNLLNWVSVPCLYTKQSKE